MKILILGEALGYRGGHFSGIPMTSERILLGPNAIHVAKAFNFQRTSKSVFSQKGFIEPTGTFVWGEIARAGLDPYSTLIWNMFPWHPYDPRKGMLSNRTPSEAELETGIRPLQDLLAMAKPRVLVAVGKKAFQTLVPVALGLKIFEVRHPANGGGGKFREQFRTIATEI